MVSTNSTTTGQSSELSLYPNPATDHIYLDFGDIDYQIEDSSITIYDVIGKVLLFKENIRPNSRINISSIPSGTYFYKLQLNEKFFTVKKVFVIKP
jgi:hypothetical protein